MGTEQEKDYSDIIGLPHHVSARHPQMPRGDRAAQFSPFAALAGYEEAVEQAAEYEERRVEQEIQRVRDPETMP